MKISVSLPEESRKSSAIVRPESPTRRRAPGGSFICPKDHGHLVDDVCGLAVTVGVLRFLHLEPELVPFACSLAHTAEDGVATEVAGHARDHLLDDDGLADTRAAEESDLAATDEWAEQVDDLDAGLEYLGLRVEVNVVGRLLVDRRSLLRLDRSA